MKQQVELVIDTGILGPRRRNGRAGYILIYRTKEWVRDVNDVIGYENVTEHESLTRIMLKALKRLKRPVHITIYTDSGYIAQALNEWMEKWQQAGWLNKKGKPVQPEWREIKEILNAHDFSVALNQKNEYSQWLRTEVRK